MAIGFNVALRNAMLNQITSRAGANAILRIYSGSRPATAGAETTILAQLTCNATFAPAAASGVLTLQPITSDTSANATGTASWWRIYAADGTTHVLDGAVSTIAAGTGDMQLDDVNIVLGGTVAISAGSFTAGNA
jgi:hypothetical protein